MSYRICSIAGTMLLALAASTYAYSGLGTGQVGKPITSSEAASIRGGCPEGISWSCPSGPKVGCEAKTLYHGSENPGHREFTETVISNCGGSATDCGQCTKKGVLCSN